jgi:hypothetical protein
VAEEINTGVSATARLITSSKKRGDDININLEESEDVDGLIKWAKNLPDDVANHSQSSFFLKF